MKVYKSYLHSLTLVSKAENSILMHNCEDDKIRVVEVKFDVYIHGSEEIDRKYNQGDPNICSSPISRCLQVCGHSRSRLLGLQHRLTFLLGVLI
jgi:hypothetical protein